MSVSGVGTYGAPSLTGTSMAPSSSSLSMDSFMQLMAVQLQNQDMSNPMDNSEMMAQLTQMATVQAMNTFTDLASTQYAMTMIGQTVTVVSQDESNRLGTKTAKVTGIDLNQMKLYIEGDTTPYGLGNVMKVGEIPRELDTEEKYVTKTGSDLKTKTEPEVYYDKIDPAGIPGVGSTITLNGKKVVVTAVENDDPSEKKADITYISNFMLGDTIKDADGKNAEITGFDWDGTTLTIQTREILKG